MATNDFVPFCPTDTGTNLEEQAAYLTDPNRTIGNQPGVASSMLNNKALRQGTAIASAVAQYVSNFLNANVLDNGNPAQLNSQLFACFATLAPAYTSLLSGAGTWNPTYMFFVASANATAGATYTNNSQTFTVVNTITAGVILQTTGTGAPAPNSGTLALASGTGDSTISYFAVRTASYVELQMVGGGGGGGATSNGGNGSATLFGTSFLNAGGGSGGGAESTDGVSGPGGTYSIGAGLGFNGVGFNGANGTPCKMNGPTDFQGGGDGAGTPFSWGGNGGGVNTPGGTPAANSGGGGGGATNNGGDVESGGGGGAGAYIQGFLSIVQPYTYQIGTGGASGGSLYNAAGAGAAGCILLTEKFQ